MTLRRNKIYLSDQRILGTQRPHDSTLSVTHHSLHWTGVWNAAKNSPEIGGKTWTKYYLSNQVLGQVWGWLLWPIPLSTNNQSNWTNPSWRGRHHPYYTKPQLQWGRPTCKPEGYATFVLYSLLIIILAHVPLVLLSLSPCCRYTP